VPPEILPWASCTNLVCVVVVVVVTVYCNAQATHCWAQSMCCLTREASGHGPAEQPLGQHKSDDAAAAAQPQSTFLVGLTNQLTVRANGSDRLSDSLTGGTGSQT